MGFDNITGKFVDTSTLPKCHGRKTSALKQPLADALNASRGQVGVADELHNLIKYANAYLNNLKKGRKAQE